MADAHAHPPTRVLQCISALLQRTLHCPTPTAHQQALHGFLDDLTPWLSPADLPTLLEQPCTLCDHLAFPPHRVEGDEDVWVALSPVGEALLRAWLRQRGLDPLGAAPEATAGCPRPAAIGGERQCPLPDGRTTLCTHRLLVMRRSAA